MAPARSLAALAVLASLARANAVIYNYTNGGQDWNATAANAKCGAGQNQSPINIVGPTYSSTLKALNVSYGASNAWNLDVTINYIEVGEIITATTPYTNITANTWTDGLTLSDGTFVPLNQFHFHSPSEHAINGAHYPLEMHMVHKLFTSNGQLNGTRLPQPPASCTAGTVAAPSTTCGALARAAVIGVMFAYDPAGNDQPFMNMLTNAFTAVKNKGADSSDETDVTQALSQFDLVNDIFNVVDSTMYYNYQGSLTTPPCSEGIDWFVMAQPMLASPNQILKFTSMLATEQGGKSRGNDNRLVQPLYSRVVSSSFTA